jgi:thiol-disulfide isomerase/thioredoxin
VRVAWLALALALDVAAAARAAEPLALADLAGKPVALAPATGTAVVAHFWATWCPSCREELGVLARAARGCGTNVEVVAIDVGEDAAAVSAYLAQQPLALRVLLDPTGRAWRGSGGRELPATLFWSGGERTWALGALSEAQWDERLAALGCAEEKGDRPLSPTPRDP